MIFFTLAFAYLFSQFYRSFLSVIATELMDDLAIGPAEFGQLGAVWFLTFALAQVPVGIALDRLGPRRTMAGMMALAVIGALLFARADTFATARAGLAINGLGCSAILMGSYYLFARVASDRFAEWSSALLAIGLIGNLAGATPLTLLAQTVGWRAALVAIAVATGLAATLVALILRDPPRASMPEPGASLLAEFRGVLAIRPLWPIMAISFGSNVILQTERGLWIGPFLEAVHGLDALAKGNGVLAMAVAMAAGALGMGAVVRLFAGPKPVVMAASVVLALSLVALALVPAGWAMAAIAFVMVMGASGMTFALQIAHARLFLPAHLTGRGITLVNLVAIGGTALVQWLSGLAVAAMMGAGLSAETVYARLHLGFALVVAIACLLYSLAPAGPKETQLAAQ